eukprot:TRINITY_DN16237_c0_g1_i1.p1 TRINITY_DN16237_c0_g1~~TRINITY_DN16237_c0_g1_i1.p1  ORF type:complete len:201 (-),score=18.48 TRINITY_DN16237_c0_g1_i1:239-841(-)
MASTVLHVRNVPCKVLEEDFTGAMRDVGLDLSRYDIYFPKKLGRQGRMNNFGYGFITCSGTEDAEEFTRAMQGFHFEGINSQKRLVVEVGNNTSANESWFCEVDHSSAPDSGRAVTFANDGIGFDAAWTSYSGVQRSWLQERSRTSAAASGCVRSVPAGPEAYDVPPTRLIADEPCLANLAAGLSDTWMNQPTRELYRYQ